MYVLTLLSNMKGKRLQVRMSERRFNKFQLYSVQVDKTMTQLIEEYVDGLQLKEPAHKLHGLED